MVTENDDMRSIFRRIALWFEKFYFYFWVVFLVILGILFTNLVFNDFKDQVIKERDEQLFNLAYSIDNTLTDEMDELIAEMNFIISGADFQKMEQEYLENGEIDELKAVLNTTIVNIKENAAGILMDTGTDIAAVSGNVMDMQFSVTEDGKEKDLIVISNSEGEFFLALKVPSFTPGITYYLLIGFENFYTEIVPESLWNENWIVFYDNSSGVATQNHDNQPSYSVMTEDEIRERKDGYTIILENELNDQRGTETYQYPNSDNELVENRIITLPSCETLNGVFAIGISRDSQELYDGLERKKNWLIAIVIIIILIGCYTIYTRERSNLEQMRMKKDMEFLERENNLVKQLTEAQIQNSVHQMQPHFIFNAMSSIRELILENPEYAYNMLYEFTRYLRSCIKAMGSSELITFSEERKNIEAYLQIEKMRLEDKLTIVWEVKDEEFSVVPLSVQPIVENAIRHGICKKRGKTGTVTIRTSNIGEWHLIEVEDDGIGFDVEEVKKGMDSQLGESIGLKNTVFRLKESLNATVAIDSTIGVGSRISILIPAREGR